MGANGALFLSIIASPLKSAFSVLECLSAFNLFNPLLCNRKDLEFVEAIGLSKSQMCPPEFHKLSLFIFLIKHSFVATLRLAAQAMAQHQVKYRHSPTAYRWENTTAASTPTRLDCRSSKLARAKGPGTLGRQTNWQSWPTRKPVFGHLSFW